MGSDYTSGLYHLQEDMVIQYIANSGMHSTQMGCKELVHETHDPRSAHRRCPENRIRMYFWPVENGLGTQSKFGVHCCTRARWITSKFLSSATTLETRGTAAPRLVSGRPPRPGGRNPSVLHSASSASDGGLQSQSSPGCLRSRPPPISACVAARQTLSWSPGRLPR